MPWTSCCRKRGSSSCPAVAIEADFLLLRDDFGAVVKLPLTSVPDVLATMQEELESLGPSKHEQLSIDANLLV